MCAKTYNINESLFEKDQLTQCTNPSVFMLQLLEFVAIFFSVAPSRA